MTQSILRYFLSVSAIGYFIFLTPAIGNTAESSSSSLATSNCKDLLPIMSKFSSLTQLQQDNWNDENANKFIVCGTGKIDEVAKNDFMDNEAPNDYYFKIILILPSDKKLSKVVIFTKSSTGLASLNKRNNFAFQGNLRTIKDYKLWITAYVTNSTEEINAKLTVPISEQVTYKDINNATYIFDLDTIKFRNGKGSKQDTVEKEISYVLNCDIIQKTLGDLDNDGSKEAAVIIQAFSGGNTPNEYLAVVKEIEGIPTNISTVDLNEGVIDSVAIKNNTIIIFETVVGPDDAYCCPSLKKIYKYKLTNNTLESINDKVMKSTKNNAPYR
jgi:hypothetical protein